MKKELVWLLALFVLLGLLVVLIGTNLISRFFGLEVALLVSLLLTLCGVLLLVISVTGAIATRFLAQR